MRRGHEFTIWLGPIALMGSRAGQSEEALAEFGCAGLAGGARARVLIGGLGMGFTLRAALKLLGPDAGVTVAELVPAVVAWGRGPLAAVHAGSLDDPRVAIHEGDVGRLIGRAASAGLAGRYDAILLDVDNGPDGLTRQGNDALYTARGLEAARGGAAPRRRAGGLVVRARRAVHGSARPRRLRRRGRDAAGARQARHPPRGLGGEARRLNRTCDGDVSWGVAGTAASTSRATADPFPSDAVVGRPRRAGPPRLGGLPPRSAAGRTAPAPAALSGSPPPAARTAPRSGRRAPRGPRGSPARRPGPRPAPRCGRPS